MYCLKNCTGIQIQQQNFWVLLFHEQSLCFFYFRDIGLLSYNDFGELCYDVVFVGDQSIKLVFICRKTSALELYLEQSFCLYTVICSSVSLSP